MAVLRMRNEKKFAIWPLLVAESLMNSAMGQILCSAERISCFLYKICNIILTKIYMVCYVYVPGGPIKTVPFVISCFFKEVNAQC